jgi:hypothetical protein
MKLRTILVLTLALMTTACTTIHFDNGKIAANSNGIKTQKWHHIVAMDLYELSKPINLKKECGEKEWVTVKSEKSAINGLAQGVTNALAPLWYPKTAEITCSE